MTRSVMIHGVLLSGALCAAYLTWTRDPSGAEDEIKILSLRGNLDKVVYASDDRTVEVEKRRDEAGSYYWLKVETLEAPPPPPPVARPPMTPPPAPGALAPAPATPVAPAKLEPKKPGAPAKPAAPAKPEPPKKAAPPAKPEAKGSTLNKDPKADPDKAPKAQPKAAPAALKAEPKAAPAAVKAEPKAVATPAPATVAPAAPAASKPPELPKIRKVQQFKGNKSVEDLIKGLSSLAAIRSLGNIDGEKLKSFGLADSKKTLTLTAGSVQRVFVIGGTTFGNMDTFIQDKGDGRVYVVRPRLLQDFLYAEFRLMDRELRSYEPADVERVVVSGEGKKKTLIHRNQRSVTDSYWADEATPDKRKEFYVNWMARMLGLRTAEYETGKAPSDMKEVLSVDFLGTGKKLGYLKVFKHQGLIPKVAGSTDEGAGDYYALSEHTRGYVKLSRAPAEEVVRDIAGLMKE